jgi:hypothetical protein
VTDGAFDAFDAHSTGVDLIGHASQHSSAPSSLRVNCTLGAVPEMTGRSALSCATLVAPVCGRDGHRG